MFASTSSSVRVARRADRPDDRRRGAAEERPRERDERVPPRRQPRALDRHVRAEERDERRPRHLEALPPRLDDVPELVDRRSCSMKPNANVQLWNQSEYAATEKKKPKNLTKMKPNFSAAPPIATATGAERARASGAASAR